MNDVLRRMLMRVIKGHIPRELRGAYYKNGPFMSTPPKKLDLHILDEGGYIQKIDFRDGKAIYSARKVDVPWRPFTVFGGPGFTPFSSMIKNAGNTNVIAYNSDNNSLLALYDGGTPYVIDKATLNTKGTIGSCDAFYNSHPKNGGNTFLKLKYVGGLTPRTILHFGPDDVTIDYNRFVYIHDFINTQRYYGFIDHKFYIDWATNGGIGSKLRNNLQELQEIVLIDKRTRNVRRIPFLDVGHKFATHFIQMHEDRAKDTLTLSAVYYPEYVRGPGSIWTSVICLKTMTMKHMPHIIAEWCEFPVEIAGRFYVTRIPDGGIAEVDKVGRHLCTRVYAKGCFYGEIAHDPISNCRLVYSYNFTKNKMTLPIFNEKWDMVCELEFPFKFVPFGLHGTFIHSII